MHCYLFIYLFVNFIFVFKTTILQVDWREWRTQMMQQLPHSWYERDDTQLTLAYFKRRHKAGRSAAPNAEWNSEGTYLYYISFYPCS
jgi:hypothetical protein